MSCLRVRLAVRQIVVIELPISPALEFVRKLRALTINATTVRETLSRIAIVSFKTDIICSWPPLSLYYHLPFLKVLCNARVICYFTPFYSLPYNQQYLYMVETRQFGVLN